MSSDGTPCPRCRATGDTVRCVPAGATLTCPRCGSRFTVGALGQLVADHTTPDPMATPPADHGSDRYDYVEVTAPAGLLPAGDWWDRAVAGPCPDCRANLFARWGDGNPPAVPDPWARRWWHVTVAHDPSCPALARIEQERRR